MRMYRIPIVAMIITWVFASPAPAEIRYPLDFQVRIRNFSRQVVEVDSFGRRYQLPFTWFGKDPNLVPDSSVILHLDQEKSAQLSKYRIPNSMHQIRKAPQNQVTESERTAKLVNQGVQVQVR